MEKTLEEKLASRHRLRCKGKDCELRKGFFVWEDQKDEIMKKKCLLCGSTFSNINLVKEK